jgi:hypothetical protein
MNSFRKEVMKMLGWISFGNLVILLVIGNEGLSVLDAHAITGHFLYYFCYFILLFHCLCLICFLSFLFWIKLK